MNFKSNTVKTIEMSITPEIAQEMLSTSIGNRVIRKWHVESLAIAQQRGEWTLTHQGAAFDRNGALRDAHHRLMACVRSGVTIRMFVTLGLEPESFDSVDQGVNRTIADITGWHKRIAEPLRLATAIANGMNRVTAQQVRIVASSGIEEALTRLVESCGSSKRFYASSPIKLAAAASMMSGIDSDFVIGQYRALCLQDFNLMTPCSQALVRQVTSLKTRSEHTRDALARGFRVFDPSRSEATKIYVSSDDIIAACEFVRNLIQKAIGEDKQKELKRPALQSKGFVWPIPANLKK